MLDCAEAVVAAKPVTFLLLNPLEPHEVGSAVVPKAATRAELRSALAPLLDGMTEMASVPVSANGRVCSLLIDLGAAQAEESLNKRATGMVWGGFRVYGPAILLPFLLGQAATTG